MVRGGALRVLGLGLAATLAAGCYGSNGDDSGAGAGGEGDAAGAGASGTGTVAGAGAGTGSAAGAGTAAGSASGTGTSGAGVPQAGAGAGVPVAPTAGAAGPGETPQPMTFIGEPCVMGETADCLCVNGGTGIKLCRYDASSPTSGAFSACGSCAEPAFDAGLSAECLGHTLRFGYSGGLVAYEESHLLGPCAELSTTRTNFGDGPSGSCESLVYDAADVSVGTVLEVLSWREVIDAFAEAPVLFGSDGRAFDAPVFRMELDGAVVELGLDCSTDSGGVCRPIPAGLTELRELLLQLVEQQMAYCGLLP